jgi:hypothetical protein
MGISRGAVKLLLEESVSRRFSGAILQLGRQDLHFSKSQLEQWGLATACPLREAPNAQDFAVKEPLRLDINDIQFFSMLGFDSVASADFSDYENSSIILDLNQPIPAELHEKFDVIFDGGTMEHCFNTFQVLKNIFSMLKKGGRVIHSSPSTNHVDHGFYMYSPTLFADYYAANNWKFLSLKVFSYTPRQNTEPCLVYDYEPGSLDAFSYGGFNDGRMLGIWCVCEKTEDSSSQNIPQQGFYTKRWSEEEDLAINEIPEKLLGKRIKIFGASARGCLVFDLIGEKCEVLGFLDNDSQKHETQLRETIIEKPTNKALDGIDFIVIASDYVVEIYDHLVSNGFPVEKIEAVGTDKRKLHSVKHWRKTPAEY